MSNQIEFTQSITICGIPCVRFTPADNCWELGSHNDLGNPISYYVQADKYKFCNRPLTNSNAFLSNVHRFMNNQAPYDAVVFLLPDNAFEWVKFCEMLSAYECKALSSKAYSGVITCITVKDDDKDVRCLIIVGGEN